MPDLTLGLTVWLTGLPSAGKTTIAQGVAKRLADADLRVEVLDGDVMRRSLTKDLGFTKADRDENVRRIGFVAEVLSRHGVVVLAPVVSPYRAARTEVRGLHTGKFFEVHVSATIDVCRARDPKGLYAGQRAGDLTGLTGIDDPYEPPLSPDLVLDTVNHTAEESVTTLWRALILGPSI